jgi:protein gp37
MSENSKIQWTHHTYNPWRGCRKVAPECANCYITSTPPFRMTGQTHGSVRVRASEKALAEPLKWNAAAERAGERHRVFCLSLGDWLDDENVPIEWLSDLLAMIHATPNLDWLLLTKRPQNWHDRISESYESFRYRPSAWMLRAWLMRFTGNTGVTAVPPDNVWIGVSAGADQKAALSIPAKVHFLSAEPMLHELDTENAAKFDWIILGGESGHNARRCDVDWIRQGVAFCKANGVACYVKQLGAKPYIRHPKHIGATHEMMHLVDKKGGDPDEWPEELRVRKFPSK